jgi:hypothetical protein
MQHGFLKPVSKTGGARAASGDAKASVVLKDGPHARGDQNRQNRRKEMKKLLVVLLSLGLLVAFGATASAVDVKFGGSYYLAGVYESNPALRSSDNAYSHAFFYQRFRLQPVFQIAEGLTATFRFDAMEMQWGQNNWNGAVDNNPQTSPAVPVAKPPRGEQANFEFERAFITFKTGIGAFQIGYQNVDDWGTDYGDYSNTRPRAQYILPLGPVTIYATYEKLFESDTAGINSAATYNTTTGYPYYTNADNDTYAISGVYNGPGVEAGFLYKYYVLNTLVNNAAVAGTNVDRPHGFSSTRTLLSPYVKATFGPLYIEGEAQYWFGKYAQYEAPMTGVKDVDLSAWGAYLKGKYQLGPAYFGALFSYASGDDYSDATKNTMNPGGAGTNFAPALILMNDALRAWTMRDSLAASGTAFVSNGIGAAIPGNSAPTSNKYNNLIYSAFVGFDPTPQLNLEANLIYATVDKKQLSATTSAVSEKLGTEIDLKATYKIYDNLSYMVGAGYLWAGDYWKGANDAAQVSNNYILMNQLTLSF